MALIKKQITDVKDLRTKYYSKRTLYIDKDVFVNSILFNTYVMNSDVICVLKNGSKVNTVVKLSSIYTYEYKPAMNVDNNIVSNNCEI